MERRDDDYYEANASDIRLEDITSSKQNAMILRRLRDGDVTLRHFTLGRGGLNTFQLGEGDDLGWLGYFIGRSAFLGELKIGYLPEDGTHAFSDGIARNQSIHTVAIDNLSNNGFVTIARALGNLSQLEKLALRQHPNAGPNWCSTLGTLLESGVWKLKALYLLNNNIGDAGVVAFANGLRIIGPSLEQLDLADNSIGNEGLSALAAALVNCTSLKWLDLSNNDFSNEGLSALAAALVNCTNLKWLDLSNNDFSNEGLSALAAALVKCTNLEWLDLSNNDFSNEGLSALAAALANCTNLEWLDLSNNDFSNEGLSALAAALVNCTSLEELDVSYNDFSSAASGLRSLSDWLQRAALNLNELRLRVCDIDDEGLQSLAETVNHCKGLNLSGNRSITASGLRYLSASLQSESCHLENLFLGCMDIGNDGAEVLARGLVGNKMLRRLHLRVEGQDMAITRAGWSAFSKALCDTSTINNTYLSNHTIQELYYWDNHDYDSDNEEGFNLDERVVQYLHLNKRHPQYAARCKILMSHTHLDMTPFLQWELKFLPLAVGWFEKAQPCTTLSIEDIDSDYERQVLELEESEEAFQSRVLTALYEFVRGMPKKVLERRDELALVAAYDDKIAMLAEDERIRKDAEQRKRKITQLEEENKRRNQRRKEEAP